MRRAEDFYKRAEDFYKRAEDFYKIFDRILTGFIENKML